MKTTDEWTDSDLPCYPVGTAYENNKFRVVHYDYNKEGNFLEKLDHWRAYFKKDGMYAVTGFFKSAKEAMNACDKLEASK
jgi:hypothetical protein